MTTLREAAQQALEALEAIREADTAGATPKMVVEARKMYEPTITALRAALAEPVLNPAPGYCKHCKQYTIEEPLPAEPVQEPVQEPVFEVGFGWLDDATKYPKGTKLYTSPPQQSVEPVQESVKLPTTATEAELMAKAGLMWLEQNAPDRLLKPVQEPVQDGKCKHCVDGCPACDARKLLVQEPVAWVLALPDGRLDRLSVVAYDDEAEEMLQRSIAGCTLVPLYAAPPQRKPLTEEEIYSLFRTVASPVMFARAIERAHEIT